MGHGVEPRRQRARPRETADAEGQQQLLPRRPASDGLHRAGRLGLSRYGVHSSPFCFPPPPPPSLSHFVCLQAMIACWLLY